MAEPPIRKLPALIEALTPMIERYKNDSQDKLLASMQNCGSAMVRRPRDQNWTIPYDSNNLIADMILRTL